MRTLLIFILVLIAIWWVRRALTRFGRSGPGADGKKRTRGAEPERMLGCAHCGLHVPESEGLRVGEDFFCCEEHRRLGPRR